MQGKNKLKKHINTNLLSLFACVVVSVCLWAYVTYVENPDMTRWIRNVPVIVTGEDALRDKGLAIGKVSHEYMDVKVRAKRNQLQYFTAETITATADVSRVSRSGSSHINVSVSLPPSSSNASVVDRRNNTVTFSIENLAEKEFDIELNITKQPPDGYIVHSFNYDSASKVKASGPSGAIDSITKVCTSSIDLSSAVTNVVYPSHLIAFDASGKAVSGITFDVSDLNVTFELYRVKEVPVSVSYSLSNAYLTASPSPKSVFISGPIAVVDAITEIKTENIDASFRHAGETIKVPLSLPAQTSLYGESPSSIDVSFTSVQ